jgi:PEP-CTERM motif
MAIAILTTFKLVHLLLSLSVITNVKAVWQGKEEKSMKRMLKLWMVMPMVMAIPLLCAVEALALPALQLDIVGGTYDATLGVESTMTSSDVFTLQAFLNPDNQGANALSDTYYLATAVVPRMLQTAGGSYGSFTVDGGTPISVTTDMDYGTPPLSALYPDLGPHGVYATFYKEKSFQFNGAHQVAAYNTQTGASEPGMMYVAKFAFDVTGLSASGLELHFDLYNENMITKKKAVDYSTEFAPYSHDAETTHKVPEPGTALLLGAGLLGLGILRRRS